MPYEHKFKLSLSIGLILTIPVFQNTRRPQLLKYILLRLLAMAAAVCAFNAWPDSAHAWADRQGLLW